MYYVLYQQRTFNKNIIFIELPNKLNCIYSYSYKWTHLLCTLNFLKLNKKIICKCHIRTLLVKQARQNIVICVKL